MKNIHKNFTGVKALQAVDFSLREGEIHALMGENGAGKSTLIKVLTGVYEKDEGEIFLKGNDKAVAIHSPQDAQNLGISTVYQEITLCPNLSVAENMFIGRTKGRMQNWKKMNADADRILQSLDIPAKATQQLASCSIAIQQMVAIARAVDMDCKVLILDLRLIVQLFAQHLCYKLHTRKFFNLVFSHQFAVPQHGDTVTYLIYLIQKVCNKDDSYTSGS